jgi:hypothetical protein
MGRTLPRTLHALCQQAAVLVLCTWCGARPGSPCATAPDGYHLTRFVWCRSHDLITTAEMDTVLDAAGAMFDTGTIIRDGAR